MSDKEAVRDLSDAATLDEILDQLTILAAIRRGEHAATAGQTISHDEMEKRAESWISK